jgi:hypothetical protein
LTHEEALTSPGKSANNKTTQQSKQSNNAAQGTNWEDLGLDIPESSEVHDDA